MIKQALAIGLGFVLAAPAFADKGDKMKDDAKTTSKNIGDEMKDAGDTAQDKLGTDSGAKKAKRHIKRSARHAKKKTRNAAKQTRDTTRDMADDMKK